MTETIAERLRRLRTEQGLTVADLAISCAVSEGAIRQIESGNVKSPSFALGLRLASALHVDPVELATGGPSPTERLERIEARLAAIEKRLPHDVRR